VGLAPKCVSLVSTMLHLMLFRVCLCPIWGQMAFTHIPRSVDLVSPTRVSPTRMIDWETDEQELGSTNGPFGGCASSCPPLRSNCWVVAGIGAFTTGGSCNGHQQRY
jgi:hypothetical protein